MFASYGIVFWLNLSMWLVTLYCASFGPRSIELTRRPVFLLVAVTDDVRERATMPFARAILELRRRLASLRTSDAHVQGWYLTSSNAWFCACPFCR